MARLLLTGGAGYVGSHCAKALAAAGHEGIVFDNLLFGHRDLGPVLNYPIPQAFNWVIHGRSA
jgi:nucleoside-diphosphate-sugar epimerase